MKDESKYIFDIIESFAYKDAKSRTQFAYHVGPLPVCRSTFCAFLGLSAASSRVKKYETMIRKGEIILNVKKINNKTALQEFARLYINAYIFVHSEKSPSDAILLMDTKRPKSVFKDYCKYFETTCRKVIRWTTFRKVWYQQLKAKITDPETAKTFAVKFRNRSKCGFKKCDDCCELKFKIHLASDKIQREASKKEFNDHLDSTKKDRVELNRVRVLCNGTTIVGFSIDAGDVNKYNTPTTCSKAKCLAGLYNKLICSE